MGIKIDFGVMVSRYGPLLVFSCLVCINSASICPQGKQFLSIRLETCVNCTECAEGDVVLRPCEIHRDTLCGPISELLKFVQPSNNPHRHKHRQRHRQENRPASASGEGGDIIWRYGDDVGKDIKQPPSSSAELDPDITSTEMPFSGAETLVWDWQAMCLTGAVFTCILFFLAISIYSFHQAKQWKRLKDNFDADVEELSARLSLMAAASQASSVDEKGSIPGGDILEAGRIGPIGDGNYLNNRCVYLEQLLNVRKDIKIGSENGGGNVYIEESTSGKA